MLESGIPLRFWVQACQNALFLTNRIVTAALSENWTPFEAWHYRKPSINHIRGFGCLAYSLIRNEIKGSKFSPVSSHGVLVGFDEDNYNYHIYDMKSQKIIVTHHASFDENTFPFLNNSTPLPQVTPAISASESDVNTKFLMRKQMMNTLKSQMKSFRARLRLRPSNSLRPSRRMLVRT